MRTPATPEAPSPGALLAAMRMERRKRCATCDGRFTTRGRGLYCSRACQQRAYRQRRAATGKPAP